MRSIPALLFVALSLSSCAGKLDYVRPTTSPVSGANVKIIEKGRDAVWAASVPALGKRFFVINNLDKSSGLMNISYSGDPESYIDCGRVTSYVKNARGERTYDFAGAKANQSYEVMNSGNLIFMERKMSLEGRVNLILEEAGPATTKVTVNTRYVIVRTIAGRSAAGGALGNSSDTISFNSGSGASFPANQLGQSTECVPRGTLEQEILSAIQ